MPIFVSSDNALGSRRGDVDDAYAITALVRGGADIAAVASIFGNTSEEGARQNNAALLDLLGSDAIRLRGAGRAGELSDAARFLAGMDESCRVAALGPLTDVAAALRIRPSFRAKEVVVVGGALSWPGRWPPWLPHEFNLTADHPATLEVFGSSLPVTIFPLDVARRLRVSRQEVEALRGVVGAYLASGTKRWFLRLLLRRFTTKFAVWDLVAALYLLDPSGFEVESRGVTMHGNTWIDFTRGKREVRVVTGFDPRAMWERLARLL